MPNIKDYFLTGTDYYNIGDYAAAVAFTAGSSYTCTQIAVIIGRGYSVPESGDAVVSVDLYSVDGSNQPLALLDNYGSITYDELATRGARYFTSGSVAITSGTKYAIVLDYTTKTGTKFITWRTGAIIAVYGWNQVVEGVWNGAGFDYQFATFESTSKPTNPVPADSLTPGVDFSNWTLSWTYTDQFESFNVYLGDSAVTLNLVTSTEDMSYTIPSGSAFRNYLLYRPAYWRVDVVSGETTTTGDVWNFDPRPAKVTTPSPADEATSVSLHPTLSWAASAIADTYDVYLDTGSLVDLVSGAQAGVSYGPVNLPYSKTYLWRIDPTNEFGTTEGDEWSFTTYAIDPPTTTYWYPDGPFYYRLVPEGVAPPTGTEGPDYEILDDYRPNLINVNKKMVVFAQGRVYYED